VLLSIVIPSIVTDNLKNAPTAKFSARTSANVSTLLAKVSFFDANVPKYLTLGAGVFSLDVVVFDSWGATTLFTIPTPVTVRTLDLVICPWQIFAA